MKNFKLALLSTLIMAAGSAVAANPTINVSGKITPPACNASITGGGDLVWNPVSHSSLSDTTFTVLPAKEATLQVQCEEGLTTHIAFWATDSDAASAIPGIVVTTGGGLNGNDINRIFGIGLDPITNNKIGNFTLIPKSSSYDSTTNSTMYGASALHTNEFHKALFSGNWGYDKTENWTVLDTTAATAVAASANSFTFTFDVIPQINTKSKITNAQEVPFKGAAQFFVRYF